MRYLLYNGFASYYYQRVKKSIKERKRRETESKKGEKLVKIGPETE